MSMWDDVGGLHDLKKLMEERIIRRINSPELFEEFGISQDGLLIYGPSGCGKTLIVKALANSFGDSVSFIHVTGSEFLTDCDANNVLAVKEIFDRARKCLPCILFFDNMDSYASSRVPNLLVSQLRCELNDNEQNQKVFILGAANRIDLLDPALLIPGRFGLKFYVSVPPNANERRLILGAIAKKKLLNVAIDAFDIVNRTECESFSGADIYRLMNEAAMAALEDKSTIITTTHMELAMAGLIEKSLS